MTVLEIEGIYYDVHQSRDGDWALVKFQDGEPVESVAIFGSRSQAGAFERHLEFMATIIADADGQEPEIDRDSLH